MPIIVNPKDTKITKGSGWTQITVANTQIMGAPAMVACRWIIEAGAHGPQLEQGDKDQLLYVIRGSGKAVVDGQDMPLNNESVLWVEPGEKYQFFAGEESLEILQGYAPGEQI